MTFLKKLGLILLKGAAFAAGLAPLVAPILGAKVAAVVGTVANDFTLIGSKVVEIEAALEGKTGVEKFQAARALVGGIIRTSELVSGKEIADEVVFQKGVDEVTQGVVDILNSIKHDEAKTA